MKKFYSVEYVDTDGELNIKHLFLSDSELQAFHQLLTESGVDGVRVHDLSQSTTGDSTAVLSGYENKPGLESGS